MMSLDTPEKDLVSRRWVLALIVGGWGALSAAAGVLTVSLGRFMFPNVSFEPPTTFKAGFPEEYEIGEVDESYKEKFGVWLVRDEEQIFAISAVCTHLGCTPNWLAAENKFKCPCHGSGFYKNGINFEGPAPRPLERFKITLAEDGRLFIDKSRKFQQEKGQWNDLESRVLV